MGFADHTDIDAALAQREQDAVQREQAARQAHAQKRASVGDKLQRVSDIQYWGRKADERIAAKKAVVAARKETNAQKQRDARARLKAGTSGNAYLKFRDEEYSRGNFNVKAITDRYNRQKERRRIEARDAQDRADDLAFARQEYEEEMAERTAPTRAMIKRAGRIPRKQRGDGYYAIHPVYGTVQHGAGLKESAASVLKHLLYK